MGVFLTGCEESPSVHGIELDPRYTDRKGDLVADEPEDPAKLLDPRRLIFAYTPVEDPAVYQDVWQEFISHLEKVTGKPVVFFPVQSNAAQLEAMRAGRLHVTGFNTGSVPLAVNVCGFIPFAMMAFEDDSFGYEMEILVPADSSVTEVNELRGRTIAFTSPTSNSGYNAPLVLLRDEFEMEPERDFEFRFSGKHDNSILGVVNKDYDAAAIANVVLKQMLDRNVVDSGDYRSIYRSPTFPTTAYGYAHNLRPELKERIREAFFSFTWEGSGLQREFAESKFIPITYKEHWEVIRRVAKDAANSGK
jgi:phosphonate transport system substrate-binding protein